MAGAATGSSSARATVRSRSTRSWRAAGFFPEEWLDDLPTRATPLGFASGPALVPGVEASTGSLGHGLPIAVGVALALRAKKADRSAAWWS